MAFTVFNEIRELLLSENSKVNNIIKEDKGHGHHSIKYSNNYSYSTKQFENFKIKEVRNRLFLNNKNNQINKENNKNNIIIHDSLKTSQILLTENNHKKTEKIVNLNFINNTNNLGEVNRVYGLKTEYNTKINDNNEKIKQRQINAINPIKNKYKKPRCYTTQSVKNINKMTELNLDDINTIGPFQTIKSIERGESYKFKPRNMIISNYNNDHTKLKEILGGKKNKIRIIQKDNIHQIINFKPEDFFKAHKIEIPNKLKEKEISQQYLNTIQNQLQTSSNSNINIYENSKPTNKYLINEEGFKEFCNKVVCIKENNREQEIKQKKLYKFNVYPKSNVLSRTLKTEKIREYLLERVTEILEYNENSNKVLTEGMKNKEVSYMLLYILLYLYLIRLKNK